MKVREIRNLHAFQATFLETKVYMGRPTVDSIDSIGVDRGETGKPARPALKKKGGGGRPAAGGVTLKVIITSYIEIFLYAYMSIWLYVYRCI